MMSSKLERRPRYGYQSVPGPVSRICEITLMGAVVELERGPAREIVGRNFYFQDNYLWLGKSLLSRVKRERSQFVEGHFLARSVNHDVKRTCAALGLAQLVVSK